VSTLSGCLTVPVFPFEYGEHRVHDSRMTVPPVVPG
jgi:hypothetical protein